MKTLLAGFLTLASFSAFALPITCYTVEKTNGIPNVKLKISDHDKVKYIFENAKETSPYIVGISYYNGAKEITYASGSVTEDHLSLTLVKDRFVQGYISATMAKGLYVGEAKRSKLIKIKCTETADEDHLRRELNIK